MSRQGHDVSAEIITGLTERLGAVHVQQRIGIEEAHEARNQGLDVFRLKNWYLNHSVIRTVLRLVGLYKRGRRNAEQVRLRTNRIESARLPAIFDGFRILHLSDLHADMSRPAMARVAELVADLDYDVCVLTGDYRGKTFGSFSAALEGVEPVVAKLRSRVYGVLGNHDSIHMVPGLEAMGVGMLLNENVPIERGGARIYLAGIDDAHFYRVDNIEKAAEGIPEHVFRILLSHTPAIFRQASHAGFDAMLAGHTHGGQICLPGSIPITLGSKLPRIYGSGAWVYEGLAGFTSVGCGSSVVAVRLNCHPEITLHELRRPGTEAHHEAARSQKKA